MEPVREIDAEIYDDWQYRSNPFDGVGEAAAKRQICAEWGITFEELEEIIERETDRRV